MRNSKVAPDPSSHSGGPADVIKYSGDINLCRDDPMPSPSTVVNDGKRTRRQVAETTRCLIKDARSGHHQRQHHPAEPKDPVGLCFNWSIFNIDKVDVVQSSFEVDIKFVVEWDLPALSLLPSSGLLTAAATEGGLDGSTTGSRVGTIAIADVWRPRLVVVNKTDQINEKFSQIRTEIGALDGQQRWSMRWRVTGVLHEVFSLQMFPFDQQNLRVVVRALDDVSVVSRLWGGIKGRHPVYHNMPLTEYTQFEHEELARSHQTNPANSTKGNVYAQMQVFVVVRRKWLYHTSVLLMPVFILTLLGVSIFEIEYQEAVGERVATEITLLLTMVSLKFAMGDMLPKLPYLTFLDMYIMGAFFFVAFLTGENYLVAKYSAKEFDEIFEIFWLVSWLAYTFTFSVWAVFITRSHKAGREVKLVGWTSG